MRLEKFELTPDDTPQKVAPGPGKVKIGECPICGKAIYWKPGKRGNRPMYCSRAHRQKAYYERKREEAG